MSPPHPNPAVPGPLARASFTLDFNAIEEDNWRPPGLIIIRFDIATQPPLAPPPGSMMHRLFRGLGMCVTRVSWG